MIYKHIKGGMYDSDTRRLNACLLTQYYFVLYHWLYVYVKKKMGWINTFWVWVWVWVWIETLKQIVYSTSLTNILNNFHIDKSKLIVEKFKY